MGRQIAHDPIYCDPLRTLFFLTGRYKVSEEGLAKGPELTGDGGLGAADLYIRQPPWNLYTK